MRVAVLGAGNGGVASAFDFAQHGHDVSLYARADHGDNIVTVAEAGGIPATGDLEGFAPVRYSGNDAGEALDGADSWSSSGRRTAPSRWPATGPHLTDGMAVLVCPGSCAGAIAFKRAAGSTRRRAHRRRRDQHAALRGADHRPGVINVFLKLTTDVYLAGFPRSGTDRLYELVKDVWPAVEKAESVFQTTLQNGNPVIHPAVTLLNAACWSAPAATSCSTRRA